MRNCLRLFAVFLLFVTTLAEARGSKERFLKCETRFKGLSRNLDMGKVDITGERDAPFGSIIDQTKAGKNYDLIKIRTRWHPEMIQSASNF